jgi:hypothetical protein
MDEHDDKPLSQPPSSPTTQCDTNRPTVSTTTSNPLTPKNAWHTQPLFRIGGAFNTHEPLCFAKGLLLANPTFLLFRMFDGSMGEPRYEMRKSKSDGQTRKVYILDMPDAALPIIYGFLWQYKTTHVTDDDLIEDTFNDCKEMSNIMSLRAWRLILAYYGFLPRESVPEGDELDEAELKGDTKIDLTSLYPPFHAFKQSFRILYDEILTKAPRWNNFMLGWKKQIAFQFARPPTQDLSDKSIVYIDQVGTEDVFTVYDLLSMKVGDGWEMDAVIEKLLEVYDAKFADSVFSVTISKPNSTAKCHRKVVDWPLTRDVDYNRLAPVSTVSDVKSRFQYLDPGYYVLKLKIAWQ